MKKILKIFTVLFTFLFILNNVNALETSFTDNFKGFAIDFDNDLNRIKIYSNDLIPGAPDTSTFFKISSQISNTSGNYAKGRMLYCADGTENSPSLASGAAEYNTDCYIRKNNRRNIAYIYEHGYGEYATDYPATEYLTGNRRKDYYITQAAMWYFTKAPSLMKNFNFEAGTYNGDSNDVTKKISKLILDAKAAGDGASLKIELSNSEMSLTNDSKYYISGPLKLTGKFINSQIKTEISGANSAFVTTNKNATSGQTAFENDSTVYIKVPVENITGEINLSLKISATTSIEESEAIQCEHPAAETYNLQPVIIFYPINTTLNDSINLKINTYQVKISKKDVNNSEEVEGATLTIKNSENNVIATWISDKTSKTVNLPSGTYILEEKIAPDGYIKSTNKIEFTVDNTGKVLVGGKEVEEVIITNEPIIITISKRSITGSDELPGAKLKITDRDGNVVKDIQENELEWISEETPRNVNLKMGDYILSETIAPEGYELSESTIEFTINSEGKVLVDGKEVENNLIIFENTPEPKQVPTGNAIIYVAGAMCLASLGVAIYYIIKRKEL